MNIEFTSTPASADIDFLTQKINQSAYVLSHYGVMSHDEALAKADGSIYTDQLWVHPAHRKNGLGQKLMEAVHDYGRKSGCRIATACTMSFQGAKSFYEKLGYVSDFERPGYTQNSSCIFLKRSL